MMRKFFGFILVFMIIGCDDNAGGGFSNAGSGDPAPTVTSKIELLSPEVNGSVEYNYVTLEVGDTVSDIKAKVGDREYIGAKNGNSFFIYNIALQTGENNISLIANNSDELNITLNSNGQGYPPVGIRADMKEGFEKLDTTLSVETSLSVSQYLLDKEDDGVVDANQSSNAFTVGYTSEGRFFPKATVKTMDGIWYSTQKNISLDVKAKPIEMKINAITESINDLERFGGYIFALSNTRVYKIDENNESKIETINLSGINNPQGFTIDDNGDLIIADTENNQVKKLDSSSNYSNVVLTIGKQGNNDGELNEPKDVTVLGIGDSQKNYVLDSGNNRVQIFDASGNYINQFDGSTTPTGKLNNPSNMVGAPDVIIADKGNNTVREISFTISGKEIETVLTNTLNFGKIEYSSNGIVFVDQINGEIVFLYRNGQISNKIKTNTVSNMAIAFNKNYTVFEALESGGIQKTSIQLDPFGATPTDIAKKFVDAFLSDNYSMMSELMGGSTGYKKLYVKEDIAKAVFSSITSYTEKIDNDFAYVTAEYQTANESGNIEFNLVRSAGQMKANNAWLIDDIY